MSLTRLIPAGVPGWQLPDKHRLPLIVDYTFDSIEVSPDMPSEITSADGERPESYDAWTPEARQKEFERLKRASENFEGHLNRDRHRTVGSHRAWCDCSSWCYPNNPCHCCRENLADMYPCSHCDGTGIGKLRPDGGSWTENT